MLGGADNPNGELLSYIIGADKTAASLSGEQTAQPVAMPQRLPASPP